MENAKCILCGANAKRKSLEIDSDLNGAVKGSSGFGYECNDCGLYSLSDSDCHQIEIFASDECKKKVAEYVKSNPDKEGNYKLITWIGIKNRFVECGK